jgi:hypothetical protein
LLLLQCKRSRLPHIGNNQSTHQADKLNQVSA